MQRLRYKENLKKDIKNSLEPFNRKKEIRNRIITFIIGIPVVFLLDICFIGLDEETKRVQILLWSIIYLIVQSAWQYFVYKINKKDVDKKFISSNQRLDRLLVDLCLKHEINVDKDDLQRAAIIEDHEKITDEVNHVKKSCETITDTVYCYDIHEKIQVLKSVRKILKEGRKVVSDETSLYLAPEEMEQVNLPVREVKKLELK